MANYSPGTIIGPGNIISANLIGIFSSGAQADGLIIRDNLIGTDFLGAGDLGNARAGIQIDHSSSNTITGDSLGAQVISGNLVGLEIDGADSTGNLIQGNLIGTDKVGHGRSRQFERRDPDRGCAEQHDRRHGFGPRAT